MNTGRTYQQIGRESEAIVVNRLIKRGYSVSSPIFGNERYDLIIDDGEALFRGQVKTAYDRTDREDAVKCDFDTTVYGSDGNPTKTYYEEGEIDCFLIYSPSHDSVLWVPFEDAPRTCITVSFRDSSDVDARTRHSVNFADDYLLTDG